MGPGIWSTGKATQEINAIAKSDAFTPSWTAHAKAQMMERDIIVGDVMHVLRLGFVFEEPTRATRDGFFKYIVEASTPNSDGRKVAVVTIPSSINEIKIITVMWRDEL